MTEMNNLLLTRLRELIRSTDALLPAQEEAVFSDAPLTLAGAGAGTGKTHTLAWRFLRALLRPGVRPRDILTLTFTEKAASEMSERINALFAKVRPVLDPENRLLTAVAEELQEAPISTIHAFSLNILREKALFLPSGLSARPITPPEEELFNRRVRDALDTLDFDWFRRTLPPGRTPEEILGEAADDLPAVLNAYSPAAVTDFAFALSNLLESRGETPDTLLESAGSDAFAPLIEERLKAIALPSARANCSLWLKEILPFLPPALPGSGAFNERLGDFRNRWTGRTPSEDENFFLAFAGDLHASLLKNLSGTGNSKSALLLAELLGERLKDHRERNASLWTALSFLEQGLTDKDFRLRTALLRTASLLWLAFREFRRRRGLVTFDDMIRLAGELTAPSAEQGTPLRIYREILVDEFQDTNALQDRLIRSVAGPESRIFLVGDLKQSIYRFRHADPTLFGELLKKQDEETMYIPLQTNFRTRPTLLDGVNAIFRRVWRDGISPSLGQAYEDLLFPENEELASSREQTPLPAVLPLIRCTEEDERAPDARKGAADLLGQALLTLRGQPVWDSGLKAMRPAEWRDMTILVPVRSSFEALEGTLFPRYGIPVAFERGKQYFNRGEIGDLRAALQTIAFPEDRHALLSFLSTPFSGLSLEELAPLFAPDKPLLGDLYPEAAEGIENLRRTARYGSLYTALAELLKNQAVLLFWPSWRRRNVLSNLWKGLDLVREYEEVFGNDPAGCAAYFARMAARPSGGEEGTPLGEEEDVVRVMTVHSAKGLEFPIVALVDLNNTRGRGWGKSLVPSLLLGAGASRYPSEWGGEESDTGKLAAFLEQTEEGEEWERLFYVGCTRARDCLILSSSCGGKEGVPEPAKGSWLSLLDESSLAFSEGGEKRENPFPVPEGEKEDLPGERGQIIPPPSLETLSLERLSATSFSLFQWCPAAWRMKYRQGVDLVWELPSSEEQGGADLGSLAHWFLARWNFKPEGLENLRSSQCPHTLPPSLRSVWREDKARLALALWLEGLARLPAGEALAERAAEGSLRRELPFRFRMTDGPLLTGSIDVLWEEEDKICIRDYKITARDESAPESAPSWEALYSSQLLFYGYAASLAEPGKNVDMRLIHLREGTEGDPVEGASSWNKMTEQLRRVARQAVSGPFAPAAERCPVCFYRFDCPFRQK
ncbi:MAG: UvrD-helicase domain-containing protein [Synergistaceae bacterium]|nr:UvrD-helicase domain-containing protein [Synergistaceae bacterium]